MTTSLIRLNWTTGLDYLRARLNHLGTKMVQHCRTQLDHYHIMWLCICPSVFSCDFSGGQVTRQGHKSTETITQWQGHYWACCPGQLKCPILKWKDKIAHPWIRLVTLRYLSFKWNLFSSARNYQIRRKTWPWFCGRVRGSSCREN